jgi:Tfp pilus assembly protein PilW
MNARPACGSSLIELLVALGLGLILLLAAATLLMSQLDEQRRLHAETRLVQELRAVADLIARDLRRAGYWGRAADNVRSAAQPPSATPASNPYGGLSLPSLGRVGYSYSRDTVENQRADSNERFGLRQNTSNRSADLRLGGSGLEPLDSDSWQALTDPTTVRITSVRFTPYVQESSLLAQCPTPNCPAAASPAECPPRRLQRSVLIEIEGESTQRPGLRRRAIALSTLRNDETIGACP